MVKIGIIGNGFVGNAIAKGFKSSVKDIRIHDKDKTKSTHTLLKTINTDFVFICLPTPMYSNIRIGTCDLTIINSFFKDLLTIKNLKNTVFILKSTVPIGTTKFIQKEYPWLNLIHNPEFLTAANAECDFANADRTILGGENPDVMDKVKQLYQDCFPDIPIHLMDSCESETVKYISNCFLATKIMFFNEMRLLSDKLGLNYELIISAIIADRRIGNTHCQVPGSDGEYGFGGTCFPKDINALIATMEANFLNPLILNAVWNQNKKLRKNWDWEDNPSAVTQR